MSGGAASFPLVLRRRHIGLAFGAAPSARRGVGSDVAGSRPYRAATRCGRSTGRRRPGSPPRETRMRSSSASGSPTSRRGSSSLSDRRPAMALCPPDLPWLRKAAALHVAALLIATSAAQHPRSVSARSTHGDGAERAGLAEPRRHRAQWRFEERGDERRLRGASRRDRAGPLAPRPAAQLAPGRELRLRPLGLPSRDERSRPGSRRSTVAGTSCPW